MFTALATLVGKKAARSPRGAWYFKVNSQTVVSCVRYGYKLVKTDTCAKKPYFIPFENYVPTINF